jgi:BolA protein
VTRQSRIEETLRTAFAPTLLEVENESRMHSVPAGSETHFKVLVVSSAFAGMSRVARHRKVNEALAAELASGLHALSIRALDPEEHAQDGAAGFESPQCLGGSKAEVNTPGSR